MIPLDAIVHFTPGDLLEDAAAGMEGGRGEEAATEMLLMSLLLVT